MNIFFLIGFLAYSYGAVQGIFQSEKSTSATFYTGMTNSSVVTASTTETGDSSYSSADVTLQAGSTINSTREH